MNYRDLIGYDNQAVPATNVEPAATHSLIQLMKATLQRIGTTALPGDPSILTRMPSIFTKVVTEAANAGPTTLATVTDQTCIVTGLIVMANTASQADLTSAAVSGGAGGVVVFLTAVDAAVANLDAVDEQVAWSGVVRLAATKTISMDLVGVGATPVDLTVTIIYYPETAGGYLA